MGCVFGRMNAGDSAENVPEQKTYSWDKREQKDLSNYQFKGLKGETRGKQSGDIGQEQFEIDSCQDCSLFLFDTSAAVTIDDCRNCDVFVGPVQGSIFIRNCHDCRIVAVCQQFRTRDCTAISSALCCQTLPIIESSSGMTFSCFRGSYFALAGQMKAAGISAYNNNWSRIHDFTKNKDEPNFTTSTEAPSWLEAFFAKAAEAVPSIAVDLDPTQATVPITVEPGRRTAGDGVLVILFPPDTKHARKLCRKLHTEEGVTLVQTAEVPMGKDECSLLLHASNTAALADACAGDGRATVISVELLGETAAAVAQAALQELGISNAYLSSDSSSSQKDIADFNLHVESIRKI